ncbi:MAG: MBOAT family O-acyltransferase [Flavipsychrobacter sp.]|jgi:alginate O-acetyltransferase complex protein AlgI|nr:MBOAT family protein [Chitinophagales bacterium]
MLFNSLGFAIFLPIVFFLYWFVFKSRQQQNILLLSASYFFYGCWDWRFLFLLVFSTLLDFYTGIKMSDARNQHVKKFWFALSIIINLSFLGFFKYYNFFAESFRDLVAHFGFKVNPFTLNIILPVGISFYTFHGLSYVIDIYHNRIKAEKKFIDYSLFVSYFPLLVAGPIERATHLLPQIKQDRTFNYSRAIDGLRQILWGLFKKIVIADQCAVFANQIFNNPTDYSGSTLVLGAVFFAFQIYGDFSGYSDIALGTSRLLGIELLRNFANPYFSRDIAEFWRRWHISLSTWFRDYLYIPLGGSKGGKWARVRNTFIIFIVSGFWHGANWTFIIWGLLNAVFIMPSIILQTNRANLNIVAQGKILPNVKEFFAMILTFSLTVFAWIFFRAKDVHHAIEYIKNIFKKSLFKVPYFPGIGLAKPFFLFLLCFIIIEWRQREQSFGLQTFGHKWNQTLRWSFYLLLVLVIYYYAITTDPQQFIYFQF